MKKLSPKELDVKIAHFLEERFSKHPELTQVADLHASKFNNEAVVSRVRNISKRFSVNKPNAQYQL